MRAWVMFLFLTGCIGLDSTLGEKAGTGTDGTETENNGIFAVDPGSVDFGTLAIGAEADEPVTVRNVSDGLLRLVANVDGDSAFTLSETSVAVAPDEDVVIDVHFEVAEGTTYAADLVIQDADLNSATIPLSGAGEGATTDTTDTSGTTEPTTPGEANLLVSPSSYDFHQIDTGSSASTTFTLKNTGDEDLLVSDLRFSDAVFVMSSSTMSLPQVIHPGDSETATVTFSPTMVRTYNGTLTVDSDDPDGDTVVALTGEGADLCDICSGLISVDTGGDPYTMDSFVSILGLPATEQVTISNVGDMDLDVSDVYVNNDTLSTCGTFTITGWRGATTLSPGGSTRFEVAYRASSVCVEVPLTSLDQNVIHILSDDPSQSDYVIELSAIGLNG